MVRGEWTLSNAVHPVHLERVQLPNSVPVDRGAIECQVVQYRDLESIAPASLDPRTRISAVEGLSA